MKTSFFFSSVILFACITFACNSNSSATNAKNDPQSPSSSNSATAGGSGGDMYYEYKENVNSNDEASGKIDAQSTFKFYISAKGDVRAETNTTFSNNGKNSTLTDVIIGHADKPNESIYIDNDKKTYSVLHFSDSDLTPGLKSQTVSVTNESNEKILGFNSVHAKIITKKYMGTFMEEEDTMEIWRSSAVPMVASVKALFDKFETKSGSGLFTQDVVSKLKQIGCEGFMTKL